MVVEPTGPLPPITVAIRGSVERLQPAMRRVADRLLADPGTASTMTISELAAQCTTSEATVVRLCHTLGLKGYPQLRLALATELGRRESADDSHASSPDIEPGDDLAAVVEKIAYADARAVEDTARTLSVGALEAVVTAIAGARRVDVYGIGASSFVAADLQQKLHRIGLVVFAVPDPHTAMTSAALLTDADVAVGISHSGSTIDTVESLALARQRGATTVAITNVPGSPLADVAHHVLVTAGRETTFRSGATASRLAQLTVVDCIFVGVAQRTYDESQQALRVTRDAVQGRRYDTRRRPGR